MPTELVNETKLVLKYADKGTFSFNKFVPDTDDENLYKIGMIINSFQKDPVQQVVKITKRIIA